MNQIFGKTIRDCGGTNKQPNAKNCNVLPSKLRLVKTFKKSVQNKKNSKNMYRNKNVPQIKKS